MWDFNMRPQDDDCLFEHTNIGIDMLIWALDDRIAHLSYLIFDIILKLNIHKVNLLGGT